MPRARPLSPEDHDALDRFLSARPATTMFLRSNLRRGGLIDRGEKYQGTWCAALEDATIVSVAACFWNGIVVMEAPCALDAVVSGVVAAAPREVTGLIGPAEQVAAARRALHRDDEPVQHESTEDLFDLSLEALVVPAPLADGRVVCRHAGEDDVPTLTEWRIAYMIETFGAARTPALEHESAENIADGIEERRQFVLTEASQLVSCSSFNAELPDCVQIGGVYTPPELRGRAHARCVVAGSLLRARSAGVARSILFTERTNAPARRAYEALGYRIVGDYAIMLWSP